MMNHHESAEITYALSNVLMSVVKASDAPVSAELHLDMAIVSLASLCDWRPTDPESLEVFTNAIKHMKLLRG